MLYYNNNRNSDKGKPSERVGRNAAGLTKVSRAARKRQTGFFNKGDKMRIPRISEIFSLIMILIFLAYAASSYAK